MRWYHSFRRRSLKFDDASPFIQLDNRKFRPVMRTSAELLNHRHAVLLPREVVANRSVLDLGCALAATGKWVLEHGASSYTGVEIQPAYADTAKSLLADHARARIVCMDAQAFVTLHAGQYDIVALIGVLHGLYNPLALLSAAAARTTDFLCVETFGDAVDGAVMRPSTEMRMPIAGRRAGSVGFGWHIAPQALALIMEHLGFAPDMEYERIGPGRYAMRYKYGSSRTYAASDLQNAHDWPAEEGACQ